MFEGSNTVPHENVYIRKNKPAKNFRNHGSLTGRISEVHERAINSKKKSHCHLVLKNAGKALISVEDLRQL